MYTSLIVIAMETIVASAAVVMVILSSFVCLPVRCQTDDPNACVSQRISESDTLQQCLQLVASIPQNPVSLIPFCAEACPTLLFELLDDCNSRTDLFDDVADVCDDRITAAIVRAESCISQITATDPLLQTCQQDFLSIIFAQPPVSLSSTDLVQQAGEEDATDCGRMLAQAYIDCGELSAIEGSVDGAGIGELIQKGGAQDEMGRFCGDLPRGVNLTTEELEERSTQYSAAHFNCLNATNTCPDECLTVLNNLGCCVQFDAMFGFNSFDILMDALDVCNVEECPVPFTLDEEPPSASQPSSDVVTKATKIMLLATALVVMAILSYN